MTLNTLKKTNTVIILILFSICFNMECKASYTKLDNSPNVLVIYSDDQAQWTVGAYGNMDVHTPNMDRLASEGMLFTQGFTKPVCSPSRAMLLTGCYSHRFDIPDYILPPTGSDRGLPPGTPTIASMLKKKGYVTGLIGKWHLGYGEKYYPELYGFDLAEGYNYQPPGKIWSLGEMLFPINGKYVRSLRSNSQNMDILAERAINFIRTNQQKPFFLYLATYWPHLSWHPIPAEDEAKYKDQSLTVPDTSIFTGMTRKTVSNKKLQDITREYYACVTCVDRNIGKVLDVLDELHLAKNTIVIFIGDNGFMVGQHGLLGKGNARVMYIDENGRYTGRQYGTRANMFDNSVLVPFIIRWPDLVKSGTRNNALVSTIDILPTLADINGISTEHLPVDGKSLLPLLRGENNSDWRTFYCDTYDMIHLGDNGEKPHMRMIRTNDWKLILYEDENGKPLDNGTRHELFNLKTDPGEMKNIYGTKSVENIREKLEYELRKWMCENNLK